MTGPDLINRESGDADIVFMGLRAPPPGGEAAYAEHLSQLMYVLPTVGSERRTRK
jgi:hypothetical protein